MVRHAGKLFPRSVSIVTNTIMAAKEVVRCYDQQGLRERRIRE